MLKEASEKDIENYVDYIYNLSTDMTKSGYPTFADGIKTKDDFIRFSKASFKHKNEKILLYLINDEVKGWIHYYYLEEDKYLTTFSFEAEEKLDEMLNEFYSLMKEEFKGYTLWIGLSNNCINGIKFLKDHDFSLIEESFNLTFDFSLYEPLLHSPNIERLKKSEFSEFKKLHDKCDMYWDSDHIMNKFDSWNIFVYRENNEIKAQIYFIDEKIMLEIFGVDFKESFNEEIYKNLIIKCLNEGKKQNSSYINYFVEDYEVPILLPLGFKNIGKYQCFNKKMEE
ncbi:MAG: hypothetical protein H6687_01905 [Bacillales bacterium]|nr:hypothetical protein [Bacillales bacterium]